MTNRRTPTNRQLEAAMATSELPTTKPAVVESTVARVTWQRELADAKDERSMIDAQIESARRVHLVTRLEGTAVCEGRIDTARRAEERAHKDADDLLTVTVESLRDRQVDLDKKIAGYEAALGASA